MTKFISSILFTLVLSLGFLSANDPIPLKAGPLNLTFDKDLAFIRYIKLGDHEVLRGINAPIRDQWWGTVQPKVENLKLEQKLNSFKMSFDAICKSNNIDFRWHGTLEGESDGTITFTFDGKAHSDFKCNRIGFCVLHGPDAAGQSLTVETVDKQNIIKSFPLLISPHQPAKNIRALVHDFAPGLRSRVDFSGEIFEMEDQRNWTDASFKTYCTPLKKPYTKLIKKGKVIQQKVVLSFDGDFKNIKNHNSSITTLTPTSQLNRIPDIGLMVSSEDTVITPIQTEQLKALKLSYLKVDLDLSFENYQQALNKADKEALKLGLDLQIGIKANKNLFAPGFYKALKRVKSKINELVLIGPNQNQFPAFKSKILGVNKNILVGMAINRDFVLLNRNRPNDSMDLVSWAINPQIHAVDNDSIMESVPMHAETVYAARSFSGLKHLMVGPLTLKEQVKRERKAHELPSTVDQRQNTNFTAAFTLGSFKYLSEAGIKKITTYETIGWKGIIEANPIPKRNGNFKSIAGEPFPVYHLLKEIADFRWGHVQGIQSSDTMKAIGLLLRKGEKTRLIVANTSQFKQTITIQEYNELDHVRSLGEISTTLSSQKQASMTAKTIQLKPYELVVIDRMNQEKQLSSKH